MGWRGRSSSLCDLRPGLRALTYLIGCSLLFQAPAASALARAKQVMVETRGLEEDLPELEATLRELFARRELSLLAPGSAATDLTIVAYVDIEATEWGAVVRIQGPQLSGPRLRREVRREGSPSVFRETLAHVVMGAVEVYAQQTALAEPSPAAASVEPRADSPDLPAQSRPASRLAYALAVRAGPVFLGSDRTQAMLNGSMGMSLARTYRPSFSIEVSGILPAHVRRDGVDADFRWLALRASPHIQLFELSRLACDAGVSAGIDWVSFVPRSVEAPTEREAITRRAQPILGASLGNRIRLSPALDLSLLLGLDLDLAPRRWVIAGDEEDVSLLELSRFRPYALLGLGWNVSALRSGAESRSP